MILYGSELSSPTNKVVYVLNYMKIPYEFHKINLAKGEHHQPEYLAINSYGKIPAISDNGFTLAESNAIIRYLANKYNANLYPHEIKEKALVDQWLDYASQHIMVPFSKIMFNTYFYKLGKAAIDSRSLDDGYTFLKRNLPAIESNLSQFKYIAGSSISLADFAMLASLDTAELSKVDLSIYPHLVTWRNKLMQQDFYLKCHTNYTETFDRIMPKLA